MALTAFRVLMNKRLNAAGLGLIDGLRLQAPTPGAHAAGSIHSLLQRVTLPAKNIVGVLAKTSRVSHAQDEWLTAVGRPLRLVVELRGVPDDLMIYIY